MELWDKVCKTNPAHTKDANVRGNKITAIAPQSQIMAATEQFGPYGTAWGFKHIDHSMLNDVGMAMIKGVFYYPGGEFPITSSISLYKDGARTKPDADFAKKLETDALTKALSKLGFNADVFMGMFDDNKYVQERQQEENESYNLSEVIKTNQRSIDAIKEGITSGELSTAAEAWFEIDDNTKQWLWVAPSKGGPFTTIERTTIQSSEFRTSYFGEDK